MKTKNSSGVLLCLLISASACSTNADTDRRDEASRDEVAATPLAIVSSVGSATTASAIDRVAASSSGKASWSAQSQHHHRGDWFPGLEHAKRQQKAAHQRSARHRNGKGTPVCAPKLTHEVVQSFAAVAEPMFNFFDVPGAAVALVEDGQIVFQKGYGVRDLETRRPVTTDTVFRVGSTTKAMTSAMVATLVDDGYIDFSTPAVDAYPGFTLPTPELTQTITLGQLMGMGTGLFEGSSLAEFETAEDLITSLQALTVAAPLGTFLYSNIVYASAAYVGLKAAGAREPLSRAYAAAMAQRIFAPVGMRPAAITENPAELTDNYAHSYGISLIGGLSLRSPRTFGKTLAASPSGGAATNVTGMAKFLITQLQGGISPDGRRVISERSLARTHAPQTVIQQDTLAYASGWLVADEVGVRTIWHGGGIDGFACLMWMVPEDGLGLVVQINAALNGAPFSNYLKETLMRLVYGDSVTPPEGVKKQYQTQHAAWAGLADGLAQQGPVDVAQVQPFLGNYEQQLRLMLDENTNRLSLVAPNLRCELAPAGSLVEAPLAFFVAGGFDPLVGMVLRLTGDAAERRLELVDPATQATIQILRKEST